jgi:predicted component of type VI protein secretion system
MPSNTKLKSHKHFVIRKNINTLLNTRKFELGSKGFETNQKKVSIVSITDIWED